MRILGIATLLACFSLGVSADRKLGYNIHNHQLGYSHHLYYGLSFEYFEAGLMAGYGKSQYFYTYRSTPSTGGAMEMVRTMETLRAKLNQALRIDAPVKVGVRNWPYFVAQLSYERIVQVNPDLVDRGVEGFSKKNEIFFYPGLGYEYVFGKKISLSLELLQRFILTDADKLKYYDSAPYVKNGRQLNIAEIDPTSSSKVSWEFGLNYIF